MVYSVRVASLISAAAGTCRANYKVAWTPLWIPPVTPTTAFFLFNGMAGVVHTAPRVTLSSDSYCSWKLKGLGIWPFLFNFVNWIISIGITCLSSFCTTSLSLRRIPLSLLCPAGGAEAQNEKKRGGGGCSWSFYQKDFVSDSANETEKSKHLISFLSHVTSSPWPFRLETMHRTHSQAAPAPSVIALFSSWYYAPGCVIKVQFNSFDVLTSWSKDMKRYDKQQRRKTD